MNTLDVFILFAFIVYSMAAGLRNRKIASESLEEYFLAGRTLKGWHAGISMAATQFAADTPLLVMGLVATGGIFALWRLWIYAIAFLFCTNVYRIFSPELLAVAAGGRYDTTHAEDIMMTDNTLSRRLALTAMVLTGVFVYDARDAHAQESQPQSERYSQKMMVGGIVTIAAGAITSTIGAIAVIDGASYRASESCDVQEWCFDSLGTGIHRTEMQIGGALLGVGVVGLAVGIPLTIIGAKKVPVNNNAFLTADSILIEPTANGVRIRF